MACQNADVRAALQQVDGNTGGDEVGWMMKDLAF